MIDAYQGETIKINIDVVDEEGVPVDLTGAEAVFSYSAEGSAAAVVKPCIVGPSDLKTTIPAEETSVLTPGSYTYEVKVKDAAGDIDMILRDTIYIHASITPEELI